MTSIGYPKNDKNEAFMSSRFGNNILWLSSSLTLFDLLWCHFKHFYYIFLASIMMVTYSLRLIENLCHMNLYFFLKLHFFMLSISSHTKKYCLLNFYVCKHVFTHMISFIFIKSYIGDELSCLLHTAPFHKMPSCV